MTEEVSERERDEEREGEKETLTPHTHKVGRVELSKVRALEAEDIKLLSESLKSNQTLKELTICAALSGADAGTYPSHI